MHKSIQKSQESEVIDSTNKRRLDFKIWDVAIKMQKSKLSDSDIQFPTVDEIHHSLKDLRQCMHDNEKSLQDLAVVLIHISKKVDFVKNNQKDVAEIFRKAACLFLDKDFNNNDVQDEDKETTLRNIHQTANPNNHNDKVDKNENYISDIFLKKVQKNLVADVMGAYKILISFFCFK